ncbi:hypothetical protein Scep_022135 [Stephania cephalantha]|uniref:DYW domain-containing protein n=1 Tax=Stephania cephalantha TaxID=152367 RepID=A0AAP0F4T0_9MAGN
MSFAQLSPPPSLSLSTKQTPLSLLTLCTHLQEANQVHAHMIKSSQISHTYSASRLAEFYAVSDRGSLECAEKLLSSVHEPYTFIWNIVLRGNLKHKRPFNAFQLFDQMLNNSVPPDHFTFTFLLKACTQLSDPERIGKQVHCQIIKYGHERNVYVETKLIHFYAVCGLLVDAHKVFDESTDLGVVAWNTMLECYANNRDGESLHLLFDRMPVRDVVSWNTMISFYVQVGRIKEAMEMFRRMQGSGEKPNVVTLVSVLSAVSQSGALAQGKWIHSYIKRNGLDLDENLGSAMINMYAKCGCLEGAIEVFNETKNKRSADTWNAMISGLSTNGQSRKAVELFGEMESAGVKPNAITFSCVLNACSHGGLVEEGTVCFRKMIEVYEIKPDIAHYGCMVDLFGRVGLFEKAKEILKTMPMQPDAVMWRALTSACRIYKNTEMGEQAGLQLMEQAPDDHTSYVLLSNIYAISGKWDRVHKVRKMMWERGVKKPPGSSSIELGGIVHEFVVGDATHVRKKEIYMMLDEMGERLKLAGYEPDTNEVLLDIDEEEMKHTSLAHHSEKLAVAFGFISTIPRTTIRVVKNLRVCNDCHSSMKLLSKIYSRDIIIRDSNRFHHFREGLCSCMDFW